ncbi:MAG: hypothetical protein ACP5JO_07150 [Candidatus Ratteibacteria bacterium]
MNMLADILKKGFSFNRARMKLFLVVFCSTCILIQSIEYIFKEEQQNQLLWFTIIFLVENFLTCGVYGSLKNILIEKTLTARMFLINCLKFFTRFLLIKLLFVIFIGFITGLLMLVAEATGKFSIPATAGIVLLWLVWLAFPSYYFILSLFAPIVMFSQDSSVLESIKMSIFFSKKAIDQVIVIAFLYFCSILIIVYFPEKMYNLSSVAWLVLKGIFVSAFEIGFINSFLLLYEKEMPHERNV